MRNTDLVKTANYISLFLILAVALVPLLAGAQFGTPDPGTTGSNLPGDATVSEIVIRIINFLLVFAGLVAVLFLIIGGFRYITAGGNEETAESGKRFITNALIGIAVIILSFVIVRIISNALATSNV